jgi:hypothetical protein
MIFLERHIESLDWITIILVGCFLLYAFSKALYPKRFQEFLLLPITNKYFLLQGKNDSLIHPFNILLFITQVFLVSLLIYLIINVLDPSKVQTNSWLYVQICTGYVVFYAVKFSFEKIIGAVFGIEKLINNYLYQKLSYRNLISIFIFIGNLVFFYVYTPSQLSIFVFMAIIVGVNAISLFSSYKSQRNLILRYFFYFILYLCALEISPYLLLYKWVVHN